MTSNEDLCKTLFYCIKTKMINCAICFHFVQHCRLSAYILYSVILDDHHILTKPYNLLLEVHVMLRLIMAQLQAMLKLFSYFFCITGQR